MQVLPPLQPMQQHSPDPAAPAAAAVSPSVAGAAPNGVSISGKSARDLALLHEQRLQRLQASAARKQAREAAVAATAAAPGLPIPTTLEAALAESYGLNRLQLEREYRRLALYATAPAQRGKAERKIYQLLQRAKGSMSAAMAGGFATAAQMVNGVATHVGDAAAAAGSAIAAAASSVASAAGAAASAAAAAVAAAVAPPAHDEADPDATNFQTEATSSVVFQAYQCRSLSFGVTHPCEVTEAGTLSGVDLPPARYPLQRSLPPHIIRDGLLSSLQLEGVLYASQRMQQILPDGTRAGFFLADGAGVGKGRQIAAIIMDSLFRGYSSRACWFSVSTDLYLEAKRDLGALGCNVRVVKGLQQIDEVTKNKNWGARDLQLHRSLREGVLFCTYGTMVSGLRGGRGKRSLSRQDQLVEWLGGEEFEGVAVYDEPHRAKHY